MAKAEHDPTRFSVEELLSRGPIVVRPELGLIFDPKLGVKEKIEKMAHWAPRLRVNSETSFGPLDKISGTVIGGRITYFIRKRAERLSSTLGISLEEYIDSLPEIPNHLDGENSELQPFIVEPRLNSGAFNIRTQSFQTEEEIDRVFKDNRQGKPRIEWGMYIPTEQIKKISRKNLENQGLRHANVQELLFAHEQYISPVRFDYLFAHASIIPEGVASIDSRGYLEYGAYEDGVIDKHNEKFNLVIKI